MSERFMFIGQVRPGRGIAASQVRENAKELASVTGENLIEGSLNIILKRPLMFINKNSIKFNHGQSLLWPASLNGIRVWLYRWSVAPPHVVELLSTVRLREALALNDDDKVIIEMQMADVGSISRAGKLVWNLCWLGRQNWYYTSDSYYSYIEGWCVACGLTQQGTKRSIKQLSFESIKQLSFAFVKKAVTKRVIKKIKSSKLYVSSPRRLH